MVTAPCALLGAVAERMKGGAAVLLATLWTLIVLYPVAHSVWAGPGSLLGDLGVIDLAGAHHWRAVPLAMRSGPGPCGLAFMSCCCMWTVLAPCARVMRPMLVD